MRYRRDPAKVAARLSRRIREARLRTGLTQAALAGRMGVSYQAVQRYEKGRSGISVDRFLALTAALGVPPATLLPGETDPMVLQSTRPIPDGHEERVLALYRRLDANNRKTIRQVLGRLARTTDGGQDTGRPIKKAIPPWIIVP
jgi:transcriptional regulator with XRE-family HTH domain